METLKSSWLSLFFNKHSKTHSRQMIFIKHSNKMAGEEDREMMKFLSKVSEVETMIKDMNSGDSDLEKAAFRKADEFLEKEPSRAGEHTKCGFNKSVINKNAGKEMDVHNAKDGTRFTEESISPETFMKRVEEDSAKRSRKRALDEGTSSKLKDQGNAAFKRGEYEIAVKNYSDAIQLIRDNAILYTNRAQAYIHLNKNEMAIEDCLAALQLNKKCIKAYVHQGRALQNLHRFDEAVGCFQKVCQIDKKHKKLMQTYILELEKSRETYNKEQKVVSLSKSGDESSTKIEKIIERLRKESISVSKIAELLCELKDLITNDLYKTLFRTAGGFKIIFENSLLSRLLKSESLDDKDEEECVFQMFELISEVCCENDENVLEVLHPTILLYLQKYSAPSTAFKVKSSTICLIHKITELPQGRAFLMENVNTGRKIIENCLSMLSTSGEQAIIALGVINNITLHDGLDKDLYEVLLSQFVPFVIKIMEILQRFNNDAELTNPLLEIMPKSISTIGNLARNIEIRTRLKTNSELKTSAAQLLELYQKSLNDEQKNKIVHSLLGFLINLFTGEASSLDSKLAAELYNSCVHFLKCDFPSIVERAAGVLNRLMSSCSHLIQEAIKRKDYKTFLSLLAGENEKAKDYIITCVVLCTSQSSELAEDLVQARVIKHLLGLLKRNEETVVGNAALCMGNCASNEKFSAKLSESDVIQDLLHIATNELYQKKVKHNAAIAIGKFAKTNQKHLEKLRELHGLEILHEVLQANKEPGS